MGLSQISTDVFLFNLDSTNDSIRLYNQINISDNEGYDNQPSFYDDTTLLFSSTRNDQTDISSYKINDKRSQWISNTSRGSEYSPLKIPGEAAVSAIRLDTNGLQRLYRYDLKSGESKELLKDLKVGYHVWYSADIIVSTVLVDDRMDLVVSNLKDHTSRTIQKNVGRSLHKIPNTDFISYISKEGSKNVVKSLNPFSEAITPLISLPETSQDVSWLHGGRLVTASDNVLLIHDPLEDQDWKLGLSFADTPIYGISRIAVSPNGKYLALVSKEAPDKLIQKQVETFNNRNLEAFIGNYADDVVVLNFPTDTLYYGKKRMRENYKKFYDRNPLVNVKVTSRITIGSSVIDHELVTIGEADQEQVAIYETDGLIKRMCFIHDIKIDADPVLVVQQQLDAYNNRDLEGFLATYAENVQIYNYPNELSTEGIKAIRSSYGEFFEKTEDLHCEVKNRIHIGNIIIDEELITANGRTFKAVAIYEVVNERIERVTFLR